MATIEVPGSYATITLALAAASNDDIINIAAGTYLETITCGTKTGLMIQGATGRSEDVIIRANVDGTSTAQMYTDCTIKNLTVTFDPQYQAPPAGRGYQNLPAVDGAGTVYHVDNCEIYSSRAGIGRSAAGSTINRSRIEYVGKSGTCATSGSEGCGGCGSYWGAYDLPGFGGISVHPAANVTSCLWLNWGSGMWECPGSWIHCTVASKINSQIYAYGIDVSNLANTISYMDSGSMAASVAAGCSQGITLYTGIRSGYSGGTVADGCITHGWKDNTANPDFMGASEGTDCFKTDDVEAAGGAPAMYVNYLAQDMRIRSGILAYRAGVNADPGGVTMPTYDLDGKPFLSGSRSIGCYEYCFGHKLNGVTVKRTSGSIGVNGTLIKNVMGVAT